MRFPMLLVILLSLLFASAPSVVLAQSHGSEVGASLEENNEEPDVLPEDAILLGEEEENGIVAMAWLYRAPSVSVEAEQGTRLPYLLFLRFLSVENNIAVEKGLVAHKLESTEGVSTPAVKMEFKNGYFVDDLTSVSPGLYILNIGCKLEDEKKRQFQYELVIN